MYDFLDYLKIFVRLRYMSCTFLLICFFCIRDLFLTTLLPHCLCPIFHYFFCCTLHEPSLSRSIDVVFTTRFIHKKYLQYQVVVPCSRVRFKSSKLFPKAIFRLSLTNSHTYTKLDQYSRFSLFPTPILLK